MYLISVRWKVADLLNVTSCPTSSYLDWEQKAKEEKDCRISGRPKSELGEARVLPQLFHINLHTSAPVHGHN
jgi:hypothetical protein